MLMFRWRSGVRSFSFVLPFPLNQPVAVLEASLLIENVEISQHVRSDNEAKQDHNFNFSGSVEEIATLITAAGHSGALNANLCSLLSSLRGVTRMLMHLIMFLCHVSDRIDETEQL